MVKVIIPLIVIFAALMDGFQHSNRKLTGSIFKSLFVGLFALAWWMDGEWWLSVYFLLSWWAFFDPVYNLVRGEHIFYVGKTKWTDKLIRKVFRETNSRHFSWITKLMALWLIIGMVIKYT